MAKKDTETKFDIDVTTQVEVGEVDAEALPMTKCICGKEFVLWGGPILSIYKDTPTECPDCGRKFYFAHQITIWEVIK